MSSTHRQQVDSALSHAAEVQVKSLMRSTCRQDTGRVDPDARVFTLGVDVPGVYRFDHKPSRSRVKLTQIALAGGVLTFEIEDDEGVKDRLTVDSLTAKTLIDVARLLADVADRNEALAA